MVAGGREVTCTTSLAHLRSRESPSTARRSITGEAGSRWLTTRVGARVAWLAEQHVPAKRYLVATDPGYRTALSEVSIRTLEQQGGAMSAEEVERFRGEPGWEAAVALRHIDDRRKIAGAPVPDLGAYRPLLARVVAAAGASSRADPPGGRMRP